MSQKNISEFIIIFKKCYELEKQILIECNLPNIK